MSEENKNENDEEYEKRKKVLKEIEHNKSNLVTSATGEVDQAPRSEKKVLKLKLTYVLAVIVVLGALVGAVYFLTSSPKTQASTVIAAGDNISMYYTGYYENGTVFGSNAGTGKPINFVVGAGQMIPGVDNAVVGMKVGESQMITIPPNEGYGYINQTIHSFTIPFGEMVNISKQLRNTTNVSVGEEFSLYGYTYHLSSFNDTNATLTGWPTLAGQTLIFNITIAGINK